MRFILDMGLSPHLAPWLQDLGHDASHLLERGQHKAADSKIIQIAQDENRIVLTADTDFAQLAANLPSSTPSIVLFRLSSYKLANVQRHLRDLLTTFQEQLARGCIISVQDNQARVRLLPIQRG